MIVEAWRRKYNEEKPKKSLSGLAPVAYAKTLTQESVKLTSDSKALCYCKWEDVGIICCPTGAMHVANTKPWFL